MVDLLLLLKSLRDFTLVGICFFKKNLILHNILQQCKVPETVAFFAFQEETGNSIEMDYCEFTDV